MTASETFFDEGEIHPIDVVETIATHYEWDFDLVAENQIAMTLEGQWRSYALTLAWSLTLALALTLPLALGGLVRVAGLGNRLLGLGHGLGRLCRRG